MTIKDELAKLHNDLAELYRGKSTDILQIKRLWLQIDRLETEWQNESDYIDYILDDMPVVD